MESRNIGSLSMFLLVHPSVIQSLFPHTFLHEGWIDFLHIGYHDQESWAADVCKIEFRSVLNLNKYGYFFRNLECLLLYFRYVVIFFIFGTVIRYHALFVLIK